MAAYEPYDLVVVPFPFTDKQASKRRPAVVLSQPVGPVDMPHYLLAMVTSAGNARWSLDHEINDWHVTGLPAPSVIRLKCFTLDQRLILCKTGELAVTDRNALSANLGRVLLMRLPVLPSNNTEQC